MGIFITLGWIALLIGLVLVIIGYTVAPQARMPGWAGVVLGVVLLILGYLLPAAHPADDYPASPPVGYELTH